MHADRHALSQPKRLVLPPPLSHHHRSLLLPRQKMNGVKHDSPAVPPTPPKSTSGGGAASITEKALPPIQGAVHSAKQTAKHLVDTASTTSPLHTQSRSPP